MNNRNILLEYQVEYVENDTPWVVAEFRSESEAFDKLEACKAAAPLREWQVIKVTKTYQRLLRTPEGCTVEV